MSPFFFHVRLSYHYKSGTSLQGWALPFRGPFCGWMRPFSVGSGKRRCIIALHLACMLYLLRTLGNCLCFGFSALSMS